MVEYLMNIQKMYEAPLLSRQDAIGDILYKASKAIVNLVYPLCKKCDYGIDKESDVIVSLTSWKARIDKVHLTIRTLLNQSYKPYKIILWLAEEEFPGKENDLPQKLLELTEKGLEIRFCENVRSHKKYFRTIQEYPEYSFITVDDDVFYPENVVEKLVSLSRKNPGVICCNWANRFVLDENGDVYSYRKWKTEHFTDVPTFACFPIGVGGVLYPSYSLHSQVTNKEAILETCITADDLWLKAMSVYNHTKVLRTDGQSRLYFTIASTKKTGLFHENVDGNKSEESWRNIMEKYPEIRNILIEEIRKETLQ